MLWVLQSIYSQHVFGGIGEQGILFVWEITSFICVDQPYIHGDDYDLLPSLNVHQNAPRLVSWHSSRENCFVLNVDGSCLGDLGRTGAWSLIRKGDEFWVSGFSCFLGTALIFVATMILKLLLNSSPSLPISIIVMLQRLLTLKSC